MSKTPESSIFGKMTSRAAGKRQIKPTAVLFATLQDNHTSDEEDDDFDVNPVENEATADSGDSSRSSSDSEASDEDEEEESESGDVTERTPSIEKEQILCGVCLNQRNVVAAGDFVQCDKCGIHVHESCYGGVLQSDPEASKWFCEPCQYGLVDPPHCEFCPSRFGAFKRADIPGKWAHVVCAKFTHGVTWSQEHTLTGISWENLENSLFGRRPCSACSDRIECRLGIASRCESGMCKESMHVTCAQKLGLLVDETDDHDSEEAIAVMRYFFCRKHSNHENLKTFQRKFAGWEKSEARRMTMHRRRKALDSEEDGVRKEMRLNLEKTIEEEDRGKKKGTVEGTEKAKQARLLNSSAEFFDRFETKAVDSGMSKQEFRDPFFNIKLTTSSYIPIGFSKEYLDFMNLRDNQIIPEEEEKLRKVRELLAETKEKHEKQTSSKQFSEKFAKNEEIIEKKQKSLEKLHSLLAELSDHIILGRDVPRGSPMVVGGASTSSSSKKEKEIYSCAVCKSSTDQHKQTQCDQCHLSYHIGCLTPPLTRLPKRNNYGWICSECNESDDSEEELTMDTSEDPSTPGTRAARSRRPPARLTAFINH